MFPIGDFNFVFCGIATVAATVGYAFTRKQASTTVPITLSPAQPEQESPLVKEKDPELKNLTQVDVTSQQPLVPRRDSLKRKEPDEGFDERTEDQGYPHNLTRIYAFKRSKTPSSESDQEPHVGQASLPEPNSVPNATMKPRDEEPHLSHTPTAPQPYAVPVTNSRTKTPSPSLTDAVKLGVEQGTSPSVGPPPTPSPIPSLHPQVTETPARARTTSVVMKDGRIPTPLTRPSTPASAFGTPFMSNSSQSAGFAAFAGSTSPFASVKKTPKAAFRASLWNIDSQAGSSSEGSTFRNSLGGAFGDSETQDLGAGEPDSHVLSAATPSNASKLSAHMTGEEDEDVEQEIKGVKLFVRRGNKPFASGMVGHLKLLSDRKTLAERLLFRREPLWQVSMNVRVNSSTRCVYDPEENVIRLTLKEQASIPSTAIGGKENLELVVYALKPGRGCSKQDFKEFADALLKNSQFAKPTQD